MSLVWNVLGRTGFPRLTKIKEDSQDLLEIDYESIDKRIIRFPKTVEESTLSLQVRTDLLRKVVLPLHRAPSWTFDYEQLGPSLCMTKVVSPSGLVEHLKYKLEGHRLPHKAPYRYIPHVEWHTVWPGNSQPEIKTKYEFSPLDGHNFLGYNAGFEWKDGQDNLYRARNEYTYTSIKAVQNGAKTTNTYNHFHLLISSKQEKNSCMVTKTVSYHAKPHQRFEDQVSYCQLPKTITMTYRDGSGRPPRCEETKQEYDEWGNPTLEVQPNGVKIHRVYYAEEGENTGSSDGLGCPRDPHGFRRHLKEQAVVPGPSEYSAPTRTEKYQYVELPTAQGADVQYFVTAKQHMSTEGKRVLSRTRFQYVDDPTVTYHGRLEKQVTFHLDKSPTTKQWTYDQSGDQLALTTSTVTCDGDVVKEQSVYSRIHGLIMEHTDQTAVKDRFEYNVLGQITKATAAVGTEQEAVRHWDYAFLETIYGTETTVTDAKGVKTRYITDGLERPCRTEKQHHDSKGYAADSASATEFHVVAKRHYDTQGQCTEVTEVDWLKGKDGRLTPQETGKRIEYDDWGEVYKTIESTGLVIISKSDPIDLTQTSGIVGEGYTKTHYDVSGNPTLTGLHKADGILCSSFHHRYDGLGRLVEEKDQLGRVTQYESDSFDRIAKTTWSDSRAVTTEYAEHSQIELPAKVSVNNVVMGEQSFDGLGRVTTRKAGPRIFHQAYEGSAPEPKHITNAKGHKYKMEYEPVLQFAPKSVNAGTTSDHYEYDSQTALPTKLKGSYSTHIREYTPSSLVKSEIMQINEGESFSSEYEYSMGGRLQHYVNPHQERQSMEYDAFGRLESLVQGKVKISFTYDSSSRPFEYIIEDQENGVKLTYILSYDDFGREIKRIIKKGEETLYSLSQTYGETGLIVARLLEDKGGVTIRGETFSYNSRNQLEHYECNGSGAPFDEKKKQIKSQTFELDQYDNIVKQTTIFQDQGTNTTTYTFSKDDPTQLITITNTHNAYPARVDLEYDANGSLTRDDQGRKLEYDALGRLMGVRDANDKQICGYRYDASGKLACQTVPGQPDTCLLYRENSLIATKSGDRRVSYVSDGKAYWGQIIHASDSDKPQNKLWASDSFNSILTWLDSEKPENVHQQSYTPYGVGAESDIGFNGQWKDPVTGWYHLGNGYRVYNPAMKRFHSPDPWSPFTSGEINSYAYCLGDPINRVDPSGHFSVFGVRFGWKRLIMAGIAITASVLVGVLTAGASIAVQMAIGAVAGAISTAVGGALATWLKAGPRHGAVSEPTLLLGRRLALPALC